MDSLTYYHLALILYTDPNILDFLTLAASVYMHVEFSVHTLVLALFQRLSSSPHFNKKHLIFPLKIIPPGLIDSLEYRDTVTPLLEDAIFHSCHIAYRLINDHQIQIAFQTAQNRSRFVYFDLSRFHTLHDILRSPTFETFPAQRSFHVSEPDEFLDYIQSFTDFMTDLLSVPTRTITTEVSPLSKNTEFTHTNYDHLDAETVLIMNSLTHIEYFHSTFHDQNPFITSVQSKSFQALSITKSMIPRRHRTVFELLSRSEFEIVCPDVHTPATILASEQSSVWSRLPLELNQAIQAESIINRFQPPCQCLEIIETIRTGHEPIMCITPISITCLPKNYHTYQITMLLMLVYIRPTPNPSLLTDYGNGIILDIPHKLSYNASHYLGTNYPKEMALAQLSKFEDTPSEPMLIPSDLVHSIVRSSQTTTKCDLHSDLWSTPYRQSLQPNF